MNYCNYCGKTHELSKKEHILAEHYDYLLAQCKDDKTLLKQWVQYNYK